MAKETDKYTRLTHKEHVKMRSGMYIGNKLNENKLLYICDKEFNSIEKKNILFNAGFLKLFDEILTNASDHVIRTNNKVKNIWITISNNSITIKNDGPGIPIAKKDNIWVPQMLFGELLTGENYNDNEDRYVGGMNGMGACLVNILSKKFIINSSDGKKTYYQEFLNNLEITNQPIVKTKTVHSYTEITYFPDLEYFNLTEITEDLIAFMRKRAFDISIYCKCNVYFNNTLIKIKELKDYAQLHLPNNTEFFYEKINDNFELVLAESITDNFEQCSIVNGISTYKGGTHVDMIMNLVIKRLIDDLTRGNKGIKIKASDIKSKFHLFLISKIINPIFDSQTKENLSIKIEDKIELSDKLYKQLLKSEIIQSILEWVQMKEQMELNKMNKKSAGKTIRVEKLVDAHKAGTNDGYKCSIILCEGDCLDENTEIRVFRDGDHVTIPIKNATIDDMVITHNGNIRQVYGITKKVKECLKICYNATSIICSLEHRFLVYDNICRHFKYLEARCIDPDVHKLVKSKLFNFNSLLEIKDIYQLNDKIYKLRIHLNDGYVDSSLSHKFTVLNMSLLKFELVDAAELKQNDLIVSIPFTKE